MKILLTAFDPFGGETVNPAQEALKQIQAPAPDMELIKLVVPTVFGASTQAVHEAMVLHQPDVVLCIGQAGGRTAITVEQIAINLMDAAIPDNQGNQPHDEPVFADGADGYFSTLPVKRMAKAVESRGIACCVSYSAGTFVCNAALYTGLYLSSRRYHFMKCCFIHVPYDETMEEALAGQPFMKRETLTEALTAAAGEAARALKAGKESGDLQEAAGTIF